MARLAILKSDGTSVAEFSPEETKKRLKELLMYMTFDEAWAELEKEMLKTLRRI